MSISSNVVAARKKSGFTQQELADKANITVRTLQRIETGRVTPRVFTVKAIATALNMEFEELQDQDASLHQLKTVQLSCFSYLVIPYVHFLIPVYVLKRHPDINKESKLKARKMIQQQILWLISTHLTLLITLIYNLIVVRFNASYAVVSYFIPFVIFYLANTLFIIYKYNRL